MYFDAGAMNDPDYRSKLEYPYSYSPIVLHIRRGKKNVIANGNVYSDRMMQWDYDKHEALLRKHFNTTNQYWDSKDPDKIELFLRDYLGYPDLLLVMITEYCNPSNGYPCWSFDYFTKEKK